MAIPRLAHSGRGEPEPSRSRDQPDSAFDPRSKGLVRTRVWPGRREQRAGAFRNETRILSPHREAKAVRAWVSRKAISSLAGKHCGRWHRAGYFFISATAKSLAAPQAMHVPKGRKVRGRNDRFWHRLRLSGHTGKHIQLRCGRHSNAQSTNAEVLHATSRLSPLRARVVALRTCRRAIWSPNSR